MDFAMLTENFEVVVMLACLIVGYIVKHASFLKCIPNDDIPILLSIIGVLVNVAVSGLSVETIVYGALMGLASTGLHQSFKSFIEKEKDA